MPILSASSADKNFEPQEKMALFIFVAMFALLPVYVFPSGGFNLADGPMFLIMVYILATHRKNEMLMQSSTLITLLAFLMWAVWVNMVHFLISSPILCIIASLQIFYTVSLFITLTIFFHRSLLNINAVKYIYLAVLVAAVIPLLMKGMSAGVVARQGLSFPNPNQLAYFAQLIFATILILNHHAGKFYPAVKRDIFIRLSTIIVIILAHVYMIFSASRAGLVGVAYLDTLGLWKNKKLFLAAFLLVTISISALNYLGIDKITGMRIYKRMMAGEYASGLSERVEGRFNFEDLSLVFGGGKTRRSLDEKKEREFKEVHNTFGDVIYSYGIIGGILFGSFIYFYFRTCSAVMYYLFVILSFLPLHVTHNMIRFRLMWIFYALVYSACLLYVQSNKIIVYARQMTKQRNPAMMNYHYAASEQKNA